MPSRLRQFIASLKANPLFMREWRRVIGPWHVLLFRAGICAIVLWIIAWKASDFLRPSSTSDYIWMDFNISMPLGLFLVWHSWRQIMFEYRQKTTHALVLSNLGDNDLFWAKFIPLLFFLVTVAAMIQIDFAYKYYLTATMKNEISRHVLAGRIVIYGLHSFTKQCITGTIIILFTHLLLLYVPSIRRTGLVIIPMLAVIPLLNYTNNFLYDFIDEPFMKSWTLTEESQIRLMWHEIRWSLLKISFAGIMTGLFAIFLMLFIAPRFHYLFTDEAPAKPFMIFKAGPDK